MFTDYILKIFKDYTRFGLGFQGYGVDVAIIDNLRQVRK